MSLETAVERARRLGERHQSHERQRPRGFGEDRQRSTTASRMRRLLRALGPRNATQAWLALLALTGACAGIAVTERGVLPWVGWLIAALVSGKAALVARHYLEVGEAAPVFRRIVWGFIGLAPLALMVTAWLESR